MNLITGGAGFIGSHLSRKLAADGMPVRVFDNLSSGSWDNLPEASREIEFLQGDLRDPDAVVQAAAGADVIYHLGAVPSVAQSVTDPRSTLDVGIAGTLNVLMASRHNDVRRVVFASSSSVYGDVPELPKREGMKPEPLSPYAISKLTGEQLCAVFTDLYGLETVSLRYFNVFGPGQKPDSQYAAVIPRFIRASRAGERVVIYGDGDQTRDFVYVDDVVAANIAASRAPAAVGRVYNVATGQPVSVNRVLELVGSLSGRVVPSDHVPARDGEIRHSLADIGAARRDLGYQPSVPFEEGLRRTFQASDGVTVDGVG